MSEKPEECQACRYKTEALKSYQMGPTKTIPARTEKWLCDLCANTASGQALEYPEFHPQGEVLYTLCYIGNAILDAVKRR